MKYLLTNKLISPDLLSKSPFDLTGRKLGVFNLFTETEESLIHSGPCSSIHDGYLRDLQLKDADVVQHTQSAIAHIQKSWPLPENITGSFSITLVDEKNYEILICNDLIGVYPLYYLLKEEEIFISNSIILTAHFSECDFDEVGIVQRCIGPEYANFGSRTILKDCKRLLPGEFLRINSAGEVIEKKYDNSLYGHISASDQHHELHKKYWEDYKREIDYCLTGSRQVNIALSGGMDSRLLLGAIPDDRKITCITYGDSDNYETKIAARLAKLKNAKFESFSETELYFPPLPVMRKYVLKTEAVLVCSWLEILENISVSRKNPFLLGDMTEALAARNIKQYSGRNFRKNNFVEYFLRKKDYEFEESSEEKFQAWKRLILHNYDRWYTEKRISKLTVTLSPSQLVAGLHKDLEEIFSRIRSHRLPFTQLYDELFYWYTHSRGPMAKQIQICNSNFASYSPPMSMQILRNTSNIHPNLRLGNRFLSKLFSLPKLKKLNRLPTSQAPLVPQNFPNFIKFPVWGIRSRIDHYLINRMMKKKDVTKRYRLFQSINWPQIYQTPAMVKNIEDYFGNNHLGFRQYEHILTRAIERKELKQWPFGNTEIIANAALNVEIELIKEFREQQGTRKE